MGSLFRAFRTFGNTLGIAWWARVDTHQPNVTYWFGPFLTRKSLRVQLPVFLEDLNSEGTHSIDHEMLRCRRSEPLTI